MPADKMKSSSSILLEGTENRCWERHTTAAFYGARPTSNLLGIQRLPWILLHRQARIMMMTTTLVAFHLHHHGLPHHHLYKGLGVLRLLKHRPKEKTTSSLPPAGSPKKWRIVIQKIDPKKKLAYEMTDEELPKQTHHELIEHFKPKVPEKRVPVDLVEAENFYNCLSDIAKRLVKLPSDYNRTLIKAHQRMRQSGKGISQPCTQQKKNLSPSE
jgi:hypothetical protein